MKHMILMGALLAPTLGTLACNPGDAGDGTAPTASAPSEAEGASPTAEGSRPGGVAPTADHDDPESDDEPAASDAYESENFRLESGLSQKRRASYVVTGQVVNKTSSTVKVMKLEIELLDASGTVIHQDRLYAARERTPAGQVNPFLYIRDLRKIQGEPVSHRAKISGFPAEGGELATITDVEKETDGSFFVYRGRIRAKGVCRSPGVVAAGYDAKGRVVDVRQMPGKLGSETGDFADRLEAGQEAFFKLTINNTDALIDRIELFDSCR
ncbi:MAG: FxLYD domain-containing protein [Polyangiaceae bacterium]